MLVHSLLVAGAVCLLFSLSYNKKANNSLLEYEEEVYQATALEQRWFWKVTELQLKLGNLSDASTALRESTEASLEEAEQQLDEARRALKTVQSLDRKDHTYTNRAEALLGAGLALVILYTVALVWRSIRPKKRHRS